MELKLYAVLVFMVFASGDYEAVGTNYGVWPSAESLSLLQVNAAKLSRDPSALSECWFTKPIPGKSPGDFIQRHTGVESQASCNALCASDSKCFGVIYRNLAGSCITLARTYDTNFMFTQDGAHVSNKVCSPANTNARLNSLGEGKFVTVVAGGAGVGAFAEERANAAEACAFSVAMRGSSPGDVLKELQGVPTLEACQRRCKKDASCLAVEHSSALSRCYTLARTYNGNFELTDDDTAVLSNKLC